MMCDGGKGVCLVLSVCERFLSSTNQREINDPGPEQSRARDRTNDKTSVCV